MATYTNTLPAFMAESSELAQEISITGKWEPINGRSFFTNSKDGTAMLEEWQAIHKEASHSQGVLRTEINQAIGHEGVLVHHVFENENSLVDYFNTTASEHQMALKQVAKPRHHLVRGAQLSVELRETIASKIDAVFANYLFGYVKNDFKKQDPASAIQVTAKWTCKDQASLDELIYWWQEVGSQAYHMEAGLVRFEVYEVIGEKALIIHETFENSDELKFHLTKGTAAIYKKEIDGIAFPENYFFRGPVSWMIRTYSKFMHLTATYSKLSLAFEVAGGSRSEGLIELKTKSTNTINMKNENVMVVYKWTAKEGKGEDLKAIYQEVSKQMQSNEPGALNVQCFYDEAKNSLVVMDLFADTASVGFHLGTTAASHFGDLLQIANPGEFWFCGDVPQEMQEAARSMGLQATFAPNVFGFERA